MNPKSVVSLECSNLCQAYVRIDAHEMKSKRRRGPEQVSGMWRMCVPLRSEEEDCIEFADLRLLFHL